MENKEADLLSMGLSRDPVFTREPIEKEYKYAGNSERRSQ